MTNTEMALKDDILTIKVDLSQRHGKSKSGKTTVIASTQGNVSCPNNPDIKIGLNIYSKGE